MPSTAIDRRRSLGWLAALLAAPLLAPLGAQAAPRPLFLSARGDGQGRYFVSGFDRDGRPAFDLALPGRGHAVVPRPGPPHSQGQAVVFARRPGGFALVLDLEAGRLVPHGAGKVTPGGGPRHMAFHPNRRFAYVINEMSNTITLFARGGDGGSLTEVEEVTTLPAGYAETTHTSDIHLSADGRFLYGSNRGHDSIAAFAVDAGSGRLTLLGHTPVPSAPPAPATRPHWLTPRSDTPSAGRSAAFNSPSRSSSR